MERITKKWKFERPSSSKKSITFCHQSNSLQFIKYFKHFATSIYDLLVIGSVSKQTALVGLNQFQHARTTQWTFYASATQFHWSRDKKTNEIFHSSFPIAITHRAHWDGITGGEVLNKRVEDFDCAFRDVIYDQFQCLLSISQPHSTRSIKISITAWHINLKIKFLMALKRFRDWVWRMEVMIG